MDSSGGGRSDSKMGEVDVEVGAILRLEGQEKKLALNEGGRYVGRFDPCFDWTYDVVFDVSLLLSTSTSYSVSLFTLLKASLDKTMEFSPVTFVGWI